MGSRAGGERRTRGGERGDSERAETREGQFDVNRSIVIRVNRLPLSSTACPPRLRRPPTEHNSRFVLLYFIPRVVEKRRCRYEPRVSTVAYHRRQDRSDLSASLKLKRKT